VLTVHVKTGKPKDQAARTLARLKQRARANDTLRYMESRPLGAGKPSHRVRELSALAKAGMHVETGPPEEG